MSRLKYRDRWQQCYKPSVGNMRNFLLLKSHIVWLVLILLSLRAAQAFDLTVIQGDEREIYTAAELIKIAPAELRTATPWDNDGEPAFLYEGVLLADLFAGADTPPVTLRATALNDYSVVIPYADAVEAGAFVAVLRDGVFMPVRNRGPYWLIFPFFADDQVQSIKDLTPWSIWQLVSLEVVE